jgi:DMSO reductase anchor subunit
VLGLGTSWLSREAVGFGLYAGLCAAYALTYAAGELPLLGSLSPALGTATALVGVGSVFCSVMVYAATRRAHWRGSITGFKFFSTMLVLGAAGAHAVGSAAGVVFAHATALLAIVLGATLCKLAFEASLFVHRQKRQHTVEKRMALLLTRELAGISMLRFGCGLAGGVLVPWLLLSGASTSASLGLSSAMLVLLLAGELAERYSFFAAAPASRMPGGLR